MTVPLSDLPQKSPSKKKLYLKTYGCQSNVYDSDRMVDILKPFGYEAVETPEGADIVILNTCHIREKAEEKVFSDLGRLRAFKEQKATHGERMLIGVAGCVAQGIGAGIIRRAPFVDMVFGPQTYHMLPQMLAQATREGVAEKKGPGRGIVLLDFPEESKFDYFPEEVQSRGPSSLLAIQEGCDKFCTYCVVPYTRGAEFSRPVLQILEEARRLVQQGTRELTLLGQNVNAYHGVGPEGEEWSLAQILRHLAFELESSGLKRLRYTTSYPREIMDDLIQLHGDLPLLMPFLHLPVQSGSDKILKDMNRKHTAQFYKDLIQKFRDVNSDLAFSSDFIVGFPGETDQDFQETLDLIQEVTFAQAYSFKYSPRPGTPAAGRLDQISDTVKRQRLDVLQTLLNQQQLAFNQGTVGKICEILIDRPGNKPGQWIGRSPYMQSVHVVAPSLSIGMMVPVEIEEGLANSLRGRLL